MKSAKRILILAAGLMIVVLLSPILFQVLSPATVEGYFEDGRCGCGYDSFIQIRGDRYHTETPLHGRGKKASTLHRRGEEWELVSPPPATNSWFMVFTNEMIVRVRMEEGDLYLSYTGRTNWMRHARVYNPWRIWLPRLQARLMAQP